MPPPLRFEDLLRTRAKRPPALGRAREIRMLARMLNRVSRNNVLVSGAPGVGKTALLHAFATAVASAATEMPHLPMLALDTGALLRRLRSRSVPAVQHLQRSLQSLPPAVVVIDDFGRLVATLADEPWPLDEFLAPFCARRGIRLLATVTPPDERLLFSSLPHRAKFLDMLPLDEPPDADLRAILAVALPTSAERAGLRADPTLAPVLFEAAKQLPSTRAFPDRALALLEEAVAWCRARGAATLTANDISTIVTERTGMPERGLTSRTRARLDCLEETLARAVIGQPHATRVVADVVRRGWLGLRNPRRPIGAFLFVGPSGVGKTELAKALAAEVFGSERALLRLDLTEYQEPHAAQRLLGAPPGYIGHDAGGQLTNPVAARPFSLILLDELEKAHANVADVFLQLLDDGRLTDGRGQTVDFTKSIVITTSNLAADLIRRAAAAGVDVGSAEFFEAHLRPRLLERFRPEFLNRFDAVVAFRPLTLETLVAIGELELQKIHARLQHHGIRFRLSRTALTACARELADPLFGARPLKRHLEGLCERALAEQLLAAPSKHQVFAHGQTPGV